MTKWNEGRALLVAMTVSTTALAATFGLAAIMRSCNQAQTAAPMINTYAANPVALTDLAASGRHLFLMNCAHCHGDDARGDEGPNLHELHKSDTHIHEVITSGIKGEMPSFTRKLNDSDIRALTAYLRTLS